MAKALGAKAISSSTKLNVVPGLDAAHMLSELRSERRAVVVRLTGEERWIDAADAGLYRDALGAAPPGGLPAAFLEDVSDALLKVARRYAATHGPFTGGELKARYGIDFGPALSELERAGDVVRGELRPCGSGREWCDPEVLRRIRRASLAVLRKEVEPVDQRSLARFLPAWQNVDRHPASGAGIDRLREALVPLQALSLPAEFLYRGGITKRVLRDAVRGLVPARVLAKREKLAYQTPEESWFSTPAFVERAREVLLDPASRSHGLYDVEAIAADAHTASWRNASALWRAMNVELWRSAFASRPPADVEVLAG